MATIRCQNCGEEAQVCLPLFCDACWRMIRNRKTKQVKNPEIQRHENLSPEHRAIVWSKEESPGATATK